MPVPVTLLGLEQLAERRRRVEPGWQSTLVPRAEASARLGVPARTLRSRAERGLLAAVKDHRGRSLVDAA
jgi:hypothetical protein